MSTSTPLSCTDVPAAADIVDDADHYSDICTSGILRGTSVPGTGTDRSLLAFTSAAVDSNGCVFFAGNPKRASTNTVEHTAQLRDQAADRLLLRLCGGIARGQMGDVPICPASR